MTFSRKLNKSKILVSLSESQQELVSGGACTETREENYTLIECSDTITDTEKQKNNDASDFVSLPIMPLKVGPSSRLSLFRFPRILF
jgi:hypothetical protein